MLAVASVPLLVGLTALPGTCRGQQQRAAAGVDLAAADHHVAAGGQDHRGAGGAGDVGADGDGAAVGVADLERAGGDVVEFGVGQAEGSGLPESTSAPPRSIRVPAVRVLNRRRAAAGVDRAAVDQLTLSAVTVIGGVAARGDRPTRL